MVLHPLHYAGDRSAEVIPAWHAVEPRQHACCDSYLLVRQPDHARLAGSLAAEFASPRLEPQIVSAISVHDAGWALFGPEADVKQAPAVNSAGKPLSFLDIEPADFVRAWTASIERAEEFGETGGFIVSEHFSRLARRRLNTVADPPSDRDLLNRFLGREESRRRRLLPHPQQAEVELLVDVLQFCDLLSLYLCCGASEEVEFPQDFGSGRIRLRHGEGRMRLDPSPFPERTDHSGKWELKLEISAGVYSRSKGIEGDNALSFVLW